MARVAKKVETSKEKKPKAVAKASKPIKKGAKGKKAEIAAAVPVLAHTPSRGSKKETLAAAVPALSRTASRASKKEAVAPVKAPALARSASKSSKTLELCLLLDCTGSMSSWI